MRQNSFNHTMSNIITKQIKMKREQHFPLISKTCGSKQVALYF